jgi:hypothetical protein
VLHGVLTRLLPEAHGLIAETPLAWIFHKPARCTCREVSRDGTSHGKGIFA